MTARQLLRDNRFFLLTWGILLTTGIVWMAIRTKGDGVLFLNQFYTHDRNTVFLFLTRLGEHTGFLVVLSTILVFRQIRHVIGFLALTLLVIAIPYLLKHYVFPDAIRPIVFLGENGLNLVKGMRPNTDFSFPSGHTTAGFAFFSYMAFMFRSPVVKFSALVVAISVAVSRVYLVQHFVQDVLAGSVLGVGMAFLCVWLIAESDWTKKIRFFNIGLLK